MKGSSGEYIRGKCHSFRVVPQIVIRNSVKLKSVKMDPLLDFEDKNMEHEKRLRREIANSNERRRMQSINAGFAGLRNLLPNHDGEKLSKVSQL